MTAEYARDSYHHQGREQVSETPIADGVLISLHERAVERRRLEEERAMFNNFVHYTQENYDVDPRTSEPAHSEAIALSAHAFLSRAVQHRIETLGKLAEKNGEPMPRVLVIPPEPVKRNIHWYYKEFGYKRRQKSDAVRAKEDAWLAENKRPIYATIREGGGTDEEGNEVPLIKVPRASYFQELALGMRLEHILRAQKHEVAADSVETLLAAYGAWFPQRIQEAIEKRRAIMRTPDRNPYNIYQILIEDIPEELRAEKLRNTK